MKLNIFKPKSNKQFFWLAVACLLTSPAHAEGLGKIKSVLQKVFDEAHSLVGIVITLAVLWCGIKILGNGDSIRDCKWIILGACLISAAAEIGSWLS